MRLRSIILLSLIAALSWWSRSAVAADTINDAAASGNVTAVRRYLTRDPRLANFVGSDGNTPLHWAAAYGRFEVVGILTSLGADVNKRRTSDGWTPLFCAAHAGKIDCVRLLINAGAEVRARATDNNTAMHWAAAGNHADVVSLLIEHGADVSARQSAGWTPLHSAASTRAPDAVRVLLQHGADMEARENGGNAPIHIAVLRGEIYSIAMLLDGGQNIDLPNAAGDTPLMVAARNGQVMAARLLAGAGADIHARDPAGHTPEEIAHQAGKKEIADLLAQYQNALTERATRDAARRASGIDVRNGYLNWAHPDARSKQVYYADFSADAVGPEWSTSPRPGTQRAPLRVSTTPAGNRRFLGDFGSQTVRLTLTGLPPHQEASVLFDLYVIRSWDGNELNGGPDVWSLSVLDGPTLLYTTFANPSPIIPKNVKMQAYPGEYPGDRHNTQSGTIEINTLGYTYRSFDQDNPTDSVYRLSYTFPHTGPALLLDFAATGLEALDNESWGIANVQVSVSAPSVIPGPHVVAVRTVHPITRPAHRTVSHRSVAQKPSAHIARANRSTKSTSTVSQARSTRRLHAKEKPPTP